jgi:hypothetical protein
MRMLFLALPLLVVAFFCLYDFLGSRRSVGWDCFSTNSGPRIPMLINLTKAAALERRESAPIAVEDRWRGVGEPSRSASCR